MGNDIVDLALVRWLSREFQMTCLAVLANDWRCYLDATN